MLCREPFDRFVQVGWNESSTNPGFDVANRNGCEFIGLGSQDTVGGVLIIPTINNNSGLKAFLVTREAPFIGLIEGPFQVKPIYIGFVPIALTTAPVLDLLVYERMPPCFSAQRADFQYGTTLSTTGNNTLTFNVRGRAGVEALIVDSAYPSADTWTITAQLFGQATPGTPGGTGFGDTFDTRVYATPAAAVRVCFNDQTGLSAAPGSPRFDRLVIANGGTVGATTAKVFVRAWD
jgi:hypothetical protein